MIVLDKKDASKFINELQSKLIDDENTHPIKNFYVKVVIKDKDIVEKLYHLGPDSNHTGKYWLLLIKNGGEATIKRFSSKWLTQFFKDNGFFDHSKILE
jgi:hypothetical protein